MRIISMEKGDNVKNIFTRFSNATAAIEQVLKEFSLKHNLSLISNGHHPKNAQKKYERKHKYGTSDKILGWNKLYAAYYTTYMLHKSQFKGPSYNQNVKT